MANPKKKIEEKLIKLTDMTGEELATRAGELAGKIQKQRLERSVGRVKNTREVYVMRKQIARIKTVLSLKYAVKSASK